MASMVSIHSSLVLPRPTFPQDPRGLDLWFAFNKEEFSDRQLALEVYEEFVISEPCSPTCGKDENQGDKEDKVGADVSSGDCIGNAVGTEPGRLTHAPIQRKVIHVISAVLVSQSDFFRRLFSPEWRGSDEEKATPVTMRLNPDEVLPFEELLRYMYTGQVASAESINPQPEALLRLLVVANKYGVMSCVNLCAHHLREVPLSLDICCILIRVLACLPLSEAATYLLEASSHFLVNQFGNLDSAWRTPEFLELPLEALEAVLSSDEVCTESEGTVFSAMVHWVRHHCPGTSPEALAERRKLVSRLATKIRFPSMEADVLRDVVGTTSEADTPVVNALVTEALWFRCSSFDVQQELVLSSTDHRRYLRRKQLSIYGEVLLQDCYMLQPGQSILLSGGAWVSGKLFSLKVMRVSAPVGGSDFGLFLQASQRSPSQDKVLDESISVEFSFKVKEWPAGMFVQQRQPASHTYKGLFRERGYRNLLNPWNDVVRDNNKYFCRGVMAIRADLRIIHPGEIMPTFE